MSSDERSTKTDALPDLDVRGPQVLAVWPGGALTCSLMGRTKLVVGRAAECDLTIDHTSVSRQHFAIHVGPATSPALHIEDLGSSNGTRLNGQRIAAHTPIAITAGAIVEVGLATLVVQGASRADTSASAAAAAASTSTSAPASSMDRVHQLIDFVASSRLTVLLFGETGVGKEVLAERLHQRSPRATKPLVRLHCAAMPEALLESELFGYERGAFTGAQAAKQGLIESADGGTVFLDEIGELSAGTQAKLLRVLEMREVQRIGSLRPTIVDVRFVAATHRDLELMSKDGRFRADLFHRLNGLGITIPPLRDRKEEIAQLARLFVARACTEAGRSSPAAIDASTLDVMHRYGWPGNIRELRNAMDRAVVMSQGGTILPSHLPPAVLASAPTTTSAQPLVPPIHPMIDGVRPEGNPGALLRDDLKQVERQRIIDALEQCGGNQTKAAKLLGISRGALVLRLDAHNLPRPRKS